MSDPYVSAVPGALITAENINLMQSKIRDDIAKQTKDAVDGIKSVPHADDSDKLEGTSKSDLIDQIVSRAVSEIRANSGYKQLFKILPVGKEVVIHHNLHLCPLVDVYQLDYFPVVCSEDTQTYGTWTTFYLSHEREQKLRWTQNGKTVFLDVQPTEGPAFHLSFKDLLSRFKVDYNDATSLDKLETLFWDAFFTDPNDRFDDNQYCHSPWFDQCCRDKKTVGDLKGDLDLLWVQFRPRKTINYPADVNRLQSEGQPSVGQDKPLPRTPAPTQIQVTQYDQDTIGLNLLIPPLLPPEPLLDLPVGSITETIADSVYKNELKVMVLLKV